MRQRICRCPACRGSGRWGFSASFLDPNGPLTSEDGKTRYKALNGPKAYEFLKTEEGKNRRVVKISDEDDSNEIFLEVAESLIPFARQGERREQYVDDNKKPIFMYKKFLGYKKGENGEPEIVPEEAAIVERIFDMYLSGKTIDGISQTLRDENIQIPGKQLVFSKKMILNILRNEKYCGDCILQKTVTVDCISKTRKKNEGEAPMYIVENSHPAIISRERFNRTQEELSRRKAIVPKSKKESITASGKYSKYALTDVLVCGECGSRYKRVTWTSRGHKRIVWRCISRLDYGKKYCKDSITVQEPKLHEAIVRALNRFNQEDESTYLALMKATIADAIGLTGSSDEVDLLERRIEALNNRVIQLVNDSVHDGEDVSDHEQEFKEIAEQTGQLKRRIKAIQESESDDVGYQERVQLLQDTIEQRKMAQDRYDDSIVRQMIECIKVFSDGRLEITFGGGYEMEEHI